jgi:hypothetical protein
MPRPVKPRLAGGEKQYQAQSQGDQAHITQDHIFTPASKPAKRKSESSEDEETGEQHDDVSLVMCIALMTWIGNKGYTPPVSLSLLGSPVFNGKGQELCHGFH